MINFDAVLSIAGENQKTPKDTSNSPASEGYSIFHETMVDMTWQEVEKAAQEGAIILTTTAVVEEHGPHMSCGIDTYLGYLWCKLTRRELEARGIKTLIAPPFYWGVNRTSHVFPGTFTVRVETMKALLHDIFNSLKSMGFNDIFNINAHMDGLHVSTAIEAVIEARKSLGLNVRYLLAEDMAKRYRLKGDESFILVHNSPPMDIESQEYLDLHAGAGETSLVAAFFPEQVNLKVAKTLPPTKVTFREIGEWLKDAKKVTPFGYLGDPASFDAGEGKKYTEDMCRMMADAIENFLKQKK
jgi:creatinine amidohydrolase